MVQQKQQSPPSKFNKEYFFNRAEQARLEHERNMARTSAEYTRIDNELARIQYNIQHLEMQLWDL